MFTHLIWLAETGTDPEKSDGGGRKNLLQNANHAPPQPE